MFTCPNLVSQEKKFHKKDLPRLGVGVHLHPALVPSTVSASPNTQIQSGWGQMQPSPVCQDSGSTPVGDGAS